MRASSVFFLVLMLDAFLFFGVQMAEQVTGDNLMVEVGDRPIARTWGYTNESLDTELNTTVWTELAELDFGGAGMLILSGSGIGTNLAETVLAPLQLLVDLLSAPWVIMNLSGLGEYWMIGQLFTLLLVLLNAFAIWKIVSGREL